jgi:uncharacterized membrane protein
MGFTVIGSYFLSRVWANEVIITTTITNTPLERKTKIKFCSDDEKKLFQLMVDTGDEIYQNELVRKSGFEAYTVSRILSRFESYGIIRKERYGITNKIWLTVEPFDLD